MSDPGEGPFFDPNDAGPPARRDLPRVSRNGICIAIALVTGLVFGTWSGLFARAFGDPAELGLATSLGSALFVYWIIGVTVWALLRLAIWSGGHMLHATARVSIIAYHSLRLPLIAALILAVIVLAIFGAHAMLGRLQPV